MRTGGGIRPGPLPQVPQRLQALGLVLIVGVQKGDIDVYKRQIQEAEERFLNGEDLLPVL